MVMKTRSRGDVSLITPFGGVDPFFNPRLR
jgi:hypothetical protein